MNNKIERIRNVNELHKTKDLTDSQAMKIISNILSEKGFYKGMIPYKKKVIGNRRNQKWTKEEDNKLRKYIFNNYPYERIAKKLGRSRHAIECRKNVLGYRPSKPI